MTSKYEGNVSTDLKAPWPVIREALIGRNVAGDFSSGDYSSYSLNNLDESQSTAAPLWSKNKFAYNLNPWIGTELLLKNIRVPGQGLYAYFPETTENILLTIGDGICELSIGQSSVVSINWPRATVDTFKDTVKAWQKHLAEHHLRGLNRQLEYIFEDEPEIGHKQAAPDTISFSAMLAYLVAKPKIKTPSIGFNRDGTFSATWIGEKKVRVTLDFVGLEKTRWVFIDSRQGIEAAITGAGTVPTAILNGVLYSYGAFDWMKL